MAFARNNFYSQQQPTIEECILAKTNYSYEKRQKELAKKKKKEEKRRRKQEKQNNTAGADEIPSEQED